MPEEDTEKLKNVGKMKKRRVKMEDGRRYLIYYTFENERSDVLEMMNRTSSEQESVNKFGKK